LIEHLGEDSIGAAWLLRFPPGRSLLEQALREKLGRRLVAIVGTSLVASALALFAWILLGRGALDGRFEPAWIVAWVLCLVSTMPLRWFEGYLQADFALRLGALLKRRLLAGAGKLDPQVVRGEGSGALLGRVFESDTLESQALGGGFLLVGAAIDLALAIWALTHAPHATAGLVLLGIWTAGSIALGLRQADRTHAFLRSRRSLTEDLVERMVGHRTRVAQEPPEQWHLEEDRRLAAYSERSRELDRSTLGLSAIVPAGFALTSFAALGYAYVAGASAPTALAIGIGAVLLGQQALSKLSGGLAQLAVCTAAWRQVAPLYHAAEKRGEPGLPRTALRPSGKALPGDGSVSLLAARGLTFRHPGRAEPALENVDLDVRPGERVLVEGPSGGGKSTLASLLAGWRTPTAGTVILRGLDRKSWGDEGWRTRIAAAPQFHENRVFTATLGFNLLMGRSAGEADLEEEERAVTLCRELGLGELVDRMPSGLRQLVGETGWQLSHGERSRVFLARALLSGSDLVVLDESLAGLDPRTAREVLETLAGKGLALVVMAHP
jgi:ATP-binding cassette subfamily B protein